MWIVDAMNVIYALKRYGPLSFSAASSNCNSIDQKVFFFVFIFVQHIFLYLSEYFV